MKKRGKTRAKPPRIRTAHGPKYRQHFRACPEFLAPCLQSLGRRHLNRKRRPRSNPLALIPLLTAMKKSLALFAALALAATGAFAQTTPPSAAPAPAGPPLSTQRPHKVQSPEKMAAHRSRKLAQQLGLNADQQSRLQAALLAERQAMTSTAPGAPADRKAMHRAMQANHAQYEAQVRTILTPDQYTQYTALEQQHRADARAKRQQRIGMAPGN